jgi:hypothetical protein
MPIDRHKIGPYIARGLRRGRTCDVAGGQGRVLSPLPLQEGSGCPRVSSGHAGSGLPGAGRRQSPPGADVPAPSRAGRSNLSQDHHARRHTADRGRGSCHGYRLDSAARDSAGTSAPRGLYRRPAPGGPLRRRRRARQEPPSSRHSHSAAFPPTTPHPVRFPSTTPHHRSGPVLCRPSRAQGVTYPLPLVTSPGIDRTSPPPWLCVVTSMLSSQEGAP